MDVSEVGTSVGYHGRGTLEHEKTMPDHEYEPLDILNIESSEGYGAGREGGIITWGITVS
jgi:hypothetical protein